MKTTLKSGNYARWYAYNEHGERKIFSFKVTNRYDAIHCLVRFGVASGWYVEVVAGSVKVNDRIYSNMKDPNYVPPDQSTDWVKDFLSL